MRTSSIQFNELKQKLRKHSSKSRKFGLFFLKTRLRKRHILELVPGSFALSSIHHRKPDQRWHIRKMIHKTGIQNQYLRVEDREIANEWALYTQKQALSRLDPPNKHPPSSLSCRSSWVTPIVTRCHGPIATPSRAALTNPKFMLRQMAHPWLQNVNNKPSRKCKTNASALGPCQPVRVPQTNQPPGSCLQPK